MAHLRTHEPTKRARVRTPRSDYGLAHAHVARSHIDRSTYNIMIYTFILIIRIKYSDACDIQNA